MTQQIKDGFGHPYTPVAGGLIERLIAGGTWVRLDANSQAIRIEGEKQSVERLGAALYVHSCEERPHTGPELCSCDESGSCGCKPFKRGTTRSDDMSSRADAMKRQAEQARHDAYQEGVAAKANAWRTTTPQSARHSAVRADAHEPNADRAYREGVAAKANAWRT